MPDPHQTQAAHYRKLAADHLSLSDAVAANSDDRVVAYIALELRMAIEAYAYNMLCLYRPQLGTAVLKQWQPSRVMKELVSIDPAAEATITVEVEFTPGEFETLGVDQRLRTKWITTSYNKLGSFVHVPTIEQLDRVALKPSDVRARCSAIAEELRAVLSAERWNFIVGEFYTLPCSCGFSMLRRRENVELGARIVCCDCGNIHRITKLSDGDIHMERARIEFTCIHCGTRNAKNETEHLEEMVGRCRQCKEPVKFMRQWGWFQNSAKGMTPALPDRLTEFVDPELPTESGIQIKLE